MAFFQNMYYACSCPDERVKKCDRECHRFRLMTHTESNADRIRAMTDEELAEWFVRIQDDVADYYDKGHSIAPELPTFDKAWLDWLKQEAEESE